MYLGIPCHLMPIITNHCHPGHRSWHRARQHLGCSAGCRGCQQQQATHSAAPCGQARGDPGSFSCGSRAVVTIQLFISWINMIPIGL